MGNAVRMYVGPASLLALLFAGLRLDRATFERVADEPAATHQCIAVTLLGAIALGFLRASDLGFSVSLMVVAEMVRVMLTLLIQSAATWLLIALVLRRERTFGNVVRPLALAGAPAVLYVVVAIGGPSVPIAIRRLLVPLWLLIAFVIGIRAAARSGLPLAVVLAVALWLLGEAVGAFAHG